MIPDHSSHVPSNVVINLYPDDICDIYFDLGWSEWSWISSVGLDHSKRMPPLIMKYTLIF